MSDDTRILVFVVWGLGCVALYGVNLVREILTWTKHHDARAIREVMVATGLFVTALCAAMSIGLVLFGGQTSWLRGWLTALSLGAFVGVGIVLVTARRTTDSADHG